ncbi:MAG: helix-turn-helix domain-containing protein [Lachnospiraceae bacterium]|nr:helix-turn-helix domain-containing protein [Lachnospiraceae bacterium]
MSKTNVEPVYVEAGKRIKELRLRKGMSRQELAASAMLSDKFLYEIESGRKGFSSAKLLRIANALDVTCDYILNGENELEIEMSEMLMLFKNKDIPKVRELLYAVSEMI